MVTHEITRNISGLARALAQQGLMTEAEAETLQTQAQTAGVSFVEQVLATKRMSASQLAVFASRAFGVPLLDLDAIDIDMEAVKSVDQRLLAKHQVLPLVLRGKRLFLKLMKEFSLEPDPHPVSKSKRALTAGRTI